jgi:cell division protein FtsW
MVYSASSALALKKFGADYYFLKRQALFAVFGIIALVLCKHAPFGLLRHLAYPVLAVALLLLGAVLIFGHTAGGATRWLRFGGFSFQPSEFARFALVVFTAFSMSKKGELVRDFSVGFLPHVLVLGIFSLLILLQPDFGSVVILGMITWIMLFVGGGRILHLVSSLLVVVPIGYLVMIGQAYRWKRIMIVLNPWAYPAEEGYQVIHSLMGFGSGGIWGAGIGKGYQKLFYLPEPHTDFIFSVIGEELGLLGVLVILGLYALILWRGFFIAKKARDDFSSFVATGLTAALGLQVCINMGVTLGMLPTKGLTLPFLSYGGTSLLMNMVSIGILMNISAPKRR